MPNNPQVHGRALNAAISLAQTAGIEADRDAVAVLAKAIQTQENLKRAAAAQAAG